MNEILMEFLLRDIVSHLPDEKREIYQYIVNEEDQLAQQAENAEHLLQLFVKHAPHRTAAKHFRLEYGQMIKLMHEIEREINEKLEERCAKVKWIDMTDKIKHLNSLKHPVFTYLLIT
ncbi:hypothetical protein [Bacillus cihuensis]|uniref:hypothetical protein n=1 Tax=Bacillus cihuensis TaxID=1208599 RepID=UPI00054FDC4A|nr:hypothetical protein [Bacillus cihuensis]